MTRAEKDRKTRIARKGKSKPKQQQGGVFPIFSHLELILLVSNTFMFLLLKL